MEKKRTLAPAAKKTKAADSAPAPADAPVAAAPEAIPALSNKKGWLGRKLKMLDNYFEITARGSNMKTEVIGGLTTFFAMCYIMLVNPAVTGGEILGVPGSGLWQAIFIATAIGAVIGTVITAFLGRMPYAQAPGMGLNAFFMLTFIAAGFGTAAPHTTDAYAAGLSIIFISGIIFLTISLTGLRKWIMQSMPQVLKKAIPAGIGLFIAFIGLQGAGIIQDNPVTLVQFADWNIVDLGTGASATWYAIVPSVVALTGLILIGFLSKTKLKNAGIIIGILISTALFYLLNIGNAAVFEAFKNIVNPFAAFGNFANLSFGAVFRGFSFWTFDELILIIVLIITFCLIDMFDTFGTLQACAAEAGLLDENGDPLRIKQCVISDSVSTLVAAGIGTSTITHYVESGAGISAGAKTGFSSIIVAALFFIAMFLSPLAAVIPSAATAPALIYVGILMIKNIKDVDFSDMTYAIPAFLTFIIMPLSYSISNGIAAGMISYTVLRALTLKFSKQDIIVAVLSALFLARFLLVSI